MRWDDRDLGAVTSGPSRGRSYIEEHLDEVYPELWAYAERAAFRLRGSLFDPVDILHRALMRAWEKAETFAGGNTVLFLRRLKSFIRLELKVAIREHVEEMRRFPRVQDELLLEDRCGPYRTAEDLFLAEEWQRALYLALHELPAHQRSFVERVFLDREPIRQVAEDLGIDASSNAYRLIERALLSLRGQIQRILRAFDGFDW